MKQSDWPVIKLVAIAKNEAPYIPLWAFHHFQIGIDLIEIHINNTDDNSNDNSSSGSNIAGYECQL